MSERKPPMGFRPVNAVPCDPWLVESLASEANMRMKDGAGLKGNGAVVQATFVTTGDTLILAYREREGGPITMYECRVVSRHWGG